METHTHTQKGEKNKWGKEKKWNERVRRWRRTFQSQQSQSDKKI